MSIIENPDRMKYARVPPLSSPSSYSALRVLRYNPLSVHIKLKVVTVTIAARQVPQGRGHQVLDMTRDRIRRGRLRHSPPGPSCKTMVKRSTQMISIW